MTTPLFEIRSYEVVQHKILSAVKYKIILLMFIWGGSAPRSNPSLFYMPFFTKMVPSFHIPCLELCISFTAVNQHCLLNRSQPAVQAYFG